LFTENLDNSSVFTSAAILGFGEVGWGEGEGHFYLWRETDYFKAVFNPLVSAQKDPGIARRHKITTYVLQIKHFILKS
jgi:hypothetical protein